MIYKIFFFLISFLPEFLIMFSGNYFSNNSSMY